MLVIPIAGRPLFVLGETAAVLRRAQFQYRPNQVCVQKLAEIEIEIME